MVRVFGVEILNASRFIYEAVLGVGANTLGGQGDDEI
jgi:hypothetical protein